MSPEPSGPPTQASPAKGTGGSGDEKALERELSLPCSPRGSDAHLRALTIKPPAMQAKLRVQYGGK